MIKCVIIEDDFSSAIDIRIKLEKHGYKVLSIVEDPDKVINNSTVSTADVIISDVKLGDGQFAFDLLSTYENLPPIIFYSSYDDAELYKRSSKLSPHVYLIKPVSGLSLHSSIQGALKTQGKAIDQSVEDSKVFIRYQGKLLSIVPEEISFIQSEGNYCYIHIKGKKIVIRSSIRKVLKMLDSISLTQVQRGYIINILMVDSFDVTNDEVHIGTHIIPVGRTYKKSAISLLKNL